MEGHVATRNADGRTERSIRTREAIVSAHVALLSQGELKPTARRVAECAGVSVRGLWTQFPDLEALFEATADRVFTEFGRRIGPIDTTQSLEQRVVMFTRRWADYLEALDPFARASEAREATSPALRDYHVRHLRRGAEEIEALFATELARLDPAARSDRVVALSAASTWRYWSNMRTVMGFDRQRAEAVMALTVTALLQAHG